jgi:glycosyltransferase involved in cell wall biosynthesis
MKIALVTDWFAPRVGGIEVHVGNLAQELRERDEDAVVVTAWPGPEDVSGVPVVRLPVRPLPGLDVSLSPRLLTSLGRVMRGGAYDVVHVHVSIGSTASITAGYVAGRLGIPVLATFHSVFRGFSRLYTGAAPILRWRRWPFRATAVSAAVAADLHRIMPERDVTLLPNAVEMDRWRVTPAPTEPHRLRLVTVGRLYPRKRTEALVRILARVRGVVGNTTDVTLEVLGDGPRRRAVAALATRLGLGDAVRLLGAGTDDDVRALLARGDLFVSACHHESFGIAALEARVAGLPVLGRREGGLDTFLTDGEDGLLVGSDEEAVSRLVALAEDPRQLDRVKAAARASLPEEYSWDRVTDRHLELYRELRATHPRSAGEAASEARSS